MEDTLCRKVKNIEGSLLGIFCQYQNRAINKSPEKKKKTEVKCRLNTVFQQKYSFILAFFIEYVCFKQYFIYSYLESVLNSSTKIQFSSLTHAKELFIAELKKDVRVIGNWLQIQNIQNNSCSHRISYFSDLLHIELYKEALMCKISLHLYVSITR